MYNAILHGDRKHKSQIYQLCAFSIRFRGVSLLQNIFIGCLALQMPSEMIPLKFEPPKAMPVNFPYSFQQFKSFCRYNILPQTDKLIFLANYSPILVDYVNKSHLRSLDDSYIYA